MATFEELLAKYKERKTNSNSLQLTDKEKANIKKAINAEDGEMVMVAPIVNALCALRFGDNFTTEQRASMVNAVKRYVTQELNMGWKKSESRFKPAYIIKSKD